MTLAEINKKMDKSLLKEEKTDPSQPFTLEILKIIKEAQQQHGLRHGDYQRYRGYCSRRIRRLRKVLKLPQGDRRHFKKRDVNESHLNNPKADERYLHIPLVLAERNWAYAMQLRQESNTEPRKRFHLIAKLRKACFYALQLEDLCKSDRCDARTKLESQAYVSWIHGTLQFELQLWAPAVENLKKAQVVYEKLASALPAELQTPYKQKVEEITPSLRYCAYNIGDNKGVDLLELRSQGILDNLDQFISQTKEKSLAILHEIKWYGVKIPIHLERVKLFLLSIEGLDESLSRTDDLQDKIKLLENMFIDLRDVISYVREEKSENKNIQLTLSYLLSIRIERTVQRNLYLIRLTKKAQEIVRLFDIIIQQFTELSQFEVLHENAEAQEDLANRLEAFKTLRCFYMAKAHAGARRLIEAVLLFERASAYAEKIIKKKLPTELEDLVRVVVESALVEKGVAHAQFVIEKEQENEATAPIKIYKSKKPLIERLDEFREEPQLLTKNPNVVSVPPPMEPIPSKPLFYDLALNFVEIPNLEDKIENEKQKQKQGGISGFVKGLWGWGGSNNK
ncbi:signal recognition particle subunit SRP68 [Agrilus planipennis]|uniref:Signal recognition particle subunit SRP68 n=1 Tax=Agrilus planipennis TaxID=224129 RepID=A0A1W4WV69_AGRPL|nr:signal recognition particle subunit SRP68 [Agrilus planipennis]